MVGLCQFGGDGDGVGWVFFCVEVEDCVVDQLVGWVVEVFGVDDLDDVGDGVFGQ